MSPLSFYKCLADDTRLKSLLLMAVHGEICVCDLQSLLSLSQPKISRHLAELRKCELVISRREGKWVFYRIHPELPSWAQNVLSQTAEENPDYFPQPLDILSTCCQETSQ